MIGLALRPALIRDRTYRLLYARSSTKDWECHYLISFAAHAPINDFVGFRTVIA